MPIKIAKDGGVTFDGSGHQNVLRAFAIDNARRVTSGVVDMTDSGGGTDIAKVQYSAPVVAVAASGSNLADKTTADAAAVKVRDALSEVIAKVNAYATALGLPTITDSLGSASADGTVGAMDAAVTGAATGVTAAATNAYIVGVNSALGALLAKANSVATALGLTVLAQQVKAGAETPKLVATLPALTVALGTAASPGVTKAAFDALLVEQRNSIKALCVFVAAFNTARAPMVVAV